MRRFLFIIFLSPFSLGAQKGSDGKWSAGLTLAAIPLPELNVGLQPGLEYRFNKRFSLLTQITIRVGRIFDQDLTMSNEKYFRVQPELRYFFAGKKRKREDYLGLRLSKASRKFEKVAGFYAVDPKQDQGFFYDRAKVSSPITTASIQGGSMFPIGRKTAIDLSFGFGARFINTRYTDVENPVSGVNTRDGGPFSYASYSIEGNIVRFHLNTGLRFIYHFGQ